MKLPPGAEIKCPLSVLERISFGISFIDNDAVKGVVLLKCTYHNSVGSFLIQDLLDILLKLHGRKV